MDFPDVFGALRAGSAPSLSSEDLAHRISMCAGGSANSPSVTRTHTDVTCVCLSLTESIISRLTTHSLPRDASLYYEDTIRRLFGEMNFMTELVSLLRCRDQLVSHLSAKCLSVYLIRDTCVSGGSGAIWTQACAEVFKRPTSGAELSSCLWTLTAVIKGVLRGDTRRSKRDVLAQLLSALDSSICELYVCLLSEDRQEAFRGEVMCELFDLLEALSAARFKHGVFSSAQRLVFAHPHELLHLMRANLEYHVKKRALLLLKKTLLGRSGEDWVLGDDQTTSQDDPGLNEDMLNVADGVLQEVDAGWLKDVPVKSQASFFGGNCDAGGTQRDDMILRAVSLILLKSLEIRIQCPRRKGADGDIDIRRSLTELMSFLRRHGSLSSPDAHACGWIAEVFAEQDDDMMESAKTLIGLYLYQKSLSVSDSSGVCVWGLNPHCHFLHLLRSLSFDHTVLLDFLISSETCFLEYCVRYLKLLRHDWTGLCVAAHHIQDCPAKTGSDPPPTVSETPSVVSSNRRSTGSDVRAEGAPRLVDYWSSDESEGDGERVFDHTQSLGEVFSCLMELRSAVTRLHQRGLFPYNPSSLIKLINTIETQRNSVRETGLEAD